MYPGAYVETTPDKPAIIHADTGEVRTFTELDSNSRKLARHRREPSPHGRRSGVHPHRL